MFHYLTIKFHFSFYASFRLFSLQIFPLLHYSNFCFEAKQSEAKFKSIFLLFFHFFHFFFAFFALNFSLRFDLAIFASKRNKAKRNSSLFFAFFAFFRFFTLNFRFASIFSLNFRLFYFVFASDFWCFAS